MSQRWVWIGMVWLAGCGAAHAQVKLGSEVLAAGAFKELQGKRVGLLTNPSGINRSGRSTIDLLRAAPGVKLVVLFGAEHGVYGDVPAGKEFKDSTDPRTGLPVRSLYAPGPVRAPTPSMLSSLDALVYDLQDTGCRSYTFISTMGMAMQACAQAGIEFVVLDRPNPLGGLRVEGPRLDEEHRKLKSLVSRWDVPYVYGLTCGELARMINGEYWINGPARLTVVPMQGWRRDMVWRDTGLKWVPTSPNVPHADSPLYYASTGMLGEIGGVNIGIGSTMPFECVIAPWLEAGKFSAQLNSYGLRGVKFDPFRIERDQSTHQGVRLRFTDPAHAPLTAINYYCLEAVRKTAGRSLFAEAVAKGKKFSTFDRVNGTTATREALERGRSAASLVASWKPGEEAFRKQRQKYLLY